MFGRTSDDDWTVRLIRGADCFANRLADQASSVGSRAYSIRYGGCDHELHGYQQLICRGWADP